MIYLKFCGTQHPAPIDEMVIATKRYSTARIKDRIRVYHEPGQWELVADDGWLNCFVMSGTGKTIDKIEAP